MTDNAFSAAYWTDRAADPAGVAAMLERTLQGLAALHPSLSDWYIAPAQPLADQDIKSWINEHQARTEQGDPHPTLGYSFFLRSNGGQAGDSLTLNVACGLHTGVPALVNSVVVSALTEAAAAVLIPLGAEVIEVLANTWHAAWAVTSDDATFDFVEAALPPARMLFPGRQTWFSGALLNARPKGAAALAALGARQAGDGLTVALPGTDVQDLEALATSGLLDPLA